MSHVFLARQPIFDRERAVTGYELLYRGGIAPRAVVEDAEAATAAVALNALTEMGLDRLVGEHIAWINVSREFLLRGLARNLPADRVVLEILEHQIVDELLLALIEDLRSSGYVLALDDFTYSPGIEDLLPLVTYVKLDLLELGKEAFAREAARLAPYHVKLVAEKVETHEEFDTGVAAGCELFQGFFFCRPEFIRDRAIAPTGMALLRLAAALANPQLQLADLEQLISNDVALSYRLLRYINSAYFGLRNRVSSIMHAVTLLGLQNVRQWATLTTFAAIDDKPRELFVTALVRARFCEHAGEPVDGSPEERFTIGLFSVLDALMDTTMETAVESLPLPPRMRDALVKRYGGGRLLDCVEAIERGDMNASVRQLGHAARHYVSALSWANDVAREIDEADADASADAA
jgi:EAL and modified HD-GYP domain-containing signal transduction protein